MKPSKLILNATIAALLALWTFGSQTVTAGDFVPYKSKGVAGLIDFPDLLPIACNPAAVEEALDGQTFDALDAGTATHLGKYASTMEMSATPIFVSVEVDPENYPGFFLDCLVALSFHGPTIIEASNGDTVHSFLIVTLNLVTNEIGGSYTVLGGSGRWEGATGEGAVVGQLNEDGSFSYETNGDISRPISRN